jgi:hypothetical protein
VILEEGKYVHMKQSIIIKLLVLFFSKQNSNESLTGTGNWSIVEVGNKHLNGDEFPDFVDLFFFFWHKKC